MNTERQQKLHEYVLYEPFISLSQQLIEKKFIRSTETCQVCTNHEKVDKAGKLAVHSDYVKQTSIKFGITNYL